MRRVAAGLILCVVLAAAGPAGATSEKPREAVPRIPWLRDLAWSEVVDRASAQDAPILIDFTATWCGPCKLLDAMVFNDRDVIAAVSDVVAFQVDIDEPRYSELKAAFAVDRLPTLVWCLPSGREVDRFTGYRGSSGFLAAVDTWRRGEDTILAAAQRQRSHPENPDYLLDLAERHRLRGDDQRAEVLYRRLENLAAGRSGGATGDCLVRMRGLLGLADIAGRTGRREMGRRLALRSSQLLNDCADERIEGLREVVACQAALGDTAGMMETWRSLMVLDDRDIAALDGFARAALQQNTELEEAARVALRAVVLSDSDPEIVETLAECYYSMGRIRRAIHWIGESISRAPDQERYRAQLTRFEKRLQEDPYGYRGLKR